MAISPTGIKITINTVAQLLGRVSSSATTFILTILLARSLGAEGYGDFSKIITYTSFFYLFADFGMNAALLQLKNVDKRFTIQHLLGTRIIISTIFVFISVSILSFFPHGSGQGYTPLVRLGVILYSGSIIAHAMITSLNAVFQEKLRYELAAIAVIVGSVFRFIITLLFGTGSVIGAIICFFMASIATATLAFRFAKKIETNVFPIFSFQHVVTICRTALPLGLMLVCNLIYFRVDSIILTITQSTHDVGVYNFAYNIFEVALVFPVFFMNTIYPLLLKRNEESLEHFFFLAKKAGTLLGITSLFIMVGVWLAAPLISLVKDEFSSGITALRILSLSIPFFYLTSLTMWMLITLKKTKLLLCIYGFVMVVNIIANIIFIPRLGFIAAAWITFFGEGLVLILSFVIVLTQTRQTFRLRRILTS